MSDKIVVVPPNELRLRMLDAVARRRAPSVSVAWVNNDEPAEAAAVGCARIAPASDATPEVAYPWFSVTKLFTATATLQLAETSKICLDDTISN
jgi:CubicO group peptidase (beta-lactamase class C family)